MKLTGTLQRTVANAKYSGLEITAVSAQQDTTVQLARFTVPPQRTTTALEMVRKTLPWGPGKARGDTAIIRP